MKVLVAPRPHQGDTGWVVLLQVTQDRRPCRHLRRGPLWASFTDTQFTAPSLSDSVLLKKQRAKAAPGPSFYSICCPERKSE